VASPSPSRRINDLKSSIPPFMRSCPQSETSIQQAGIITYTSSNVQPHCREWREDAGCSFLPRPCSQVRPLARSLASDVWAVNNCWRLLSSLSKRSFDILLNDQFTGCFCVLICPRMTFSVVRFQASPNLQPENSVQSRQSLQINKSVRR
jgi:hypothetical protein